MEKANKPQYRAGLVVQCDDTSLEIYHEFKIYRSARTERASQTNRADWVAFKIDEDAKVVEADLKPIPRRWGSVVDNEGDIRLTVNAVIRNVIDYPVFKYLDERPQMSPNRPWSFELDWLDDPKGLMSYRRGVREGWMHEVTVKFVQNEDDFSFPILEVHYESPDEMQLNSFYAPWVEEMLITMKTVGDGMQPIRERETGKVHIKNRLHGIIMRANTAEQRYFVWSKESGMLYIHMLRENFANMNVGNFVLFRVVPRTHQNDMVATTLTLSQNVMKDTKILDASQNQIDAAVKTPFLIPPADKCGNQIEQVDLFLGLIRVSKNVMERKLSEIGKTLDDVYGKKIWIWVSAKNLLADDQRGTEPRFWSFDHLDDDLFDDEAI